jgi:DNA-binding NtrC family response regulator
VKDSTGSERNVSRITVLSVGPHEQDHAGLAEIFPRAQWTLCPQSLWTLKTSQSLASALLALQTDPIPLVVCEDDLGTTTWRDLWDEIASMPDPPSLIVTSRLADERLWAEALNLGVYDVLSKPFDSGEVVRTLSQAWLQRTGRKHASAAYPRVAIDSRAGLAV